MDDAVLEKIYQEKLEKRIIATLAEKHGISLEEAMNVYYNSKLADKIHSLPYIIADNIAEFFIVHQSDKSILVRHAKVTVNRIHPLDSKLHSPAAVRHAGIYIDM